MIIPLLRPKIYDLQLALELFKKSQKEFKLSNFGPCYTQAKELLDDFTQGHSVLIKSGTEAIKIALQTTLKQGSRVAIPDYTHIGTLSAVVSAGMTPVIFPTDKHTWTICHKKLFENKEEFDGFIAVSPFGYWINWQAYDCLAEYHNKKVVYDLAGGFGMYIKTKNPVCYSFHATKNISCGEGGAAVFNKKNEAEEARMLSTFSISPDMQILNERGSNAKMDELHCAILSSWLLNMDAIDQKIDAKRELIDFYQEELSDHILSIHQHFLGSPSLCVLQGLNAKYITEEGRRVGIEFKPYYPLLSKIPGLMHIKRFGQSSFNFETCLALPSDVAKKEALQVVKFLRMILV